MLDEWVQHLPKQIFYWFSTPQFYLLLLLLFPNAYLFLSSHCIYHLCQCSLDLLSLPKISMAFWNSPVSALVRDWKSLHEVIPLTLESKISIIKAFPETMITEFSLSSQGWHWLYATGIQQDSLMEELGIPMADHVEVWQKTAKFYKAIILQLKIN